jgi:hypothetical protein
VDTTILGCTPEEAAEKPFIASMGIYVFKRKALLEMLDSNPTDMDFGGQVIPHAKEAGALNPLTPGCMSHWQCPYLCLKHLLHTLSSRPLSQPHVWCGATLFRTAARRISAGL